MAPEYSGRGEGARSMALLWGTHPKASRGPKAALSLEQVVAAAVELADAEGLDAVSMRRVAERLGIATMSIYTYVPGKAELLDLMLDRVNAERDTNLTKDRWREGLEAMARDQWAMYERHPWTLYVASGRGTLGPNELDAYEAAMRVVAGLGLPARDVVAIVDALSMYVRGAARDAAEAAGAAEATGTSEADWWYEREPILEELMAPDRFPTLTRLGGEGGFDVPDDTPNYNLRFALDDFEFGLQRYLDGVEAFIGGRPAS
jgi:AcrR family transcriptional regulator